MAEAEPAKAGRPSHADVIARLVEEVTVLNTRLDLLEDEVARKQNEPTVYTNPKAEQDPTEYCEGCGSVLPFHFETADGPCRLTPAPPETVAA